MRNIGETSRRGDLELVAPVSDVSLTNRVMDAGADAIYVGLKGFSARPDQWSLSVEEIADARKITRARGKRLYVALNSELPREKEKEAVENLKVLEDISVDAVVIGDWGLLVQKKWAAVGLPVHASTLLGISNPWSLELAATFGVTRVIINTNLFLDEIADLTATPGFEFEIISWGVCFNDCRRCRLPHRVNQKNRFQVGCKAYYRVGVTGSNGSEPRRWIWSPDVDVSSDLLRLWTALGIRSFKLEGRTQSIETIERNIGALKTKLDRLSCCNQLLEKDVNPYHYLIHYSRIGRAQ